MQAHQVKVRLEVQGVEGLGHLRGVVVCPATLIVIVAVCILRMRALGACPGGGQDDVHILEPASRYGLQLL